MSSRARRQGLDGWMEIVPKVGRVGPKSVVTALRASDCTSVGISGGLIPAFRQDARAGPRPAPRLVGSGTGAVTQ
jgi:hypothetical protein